MALKITMRDVARVCKVSPMTVSRVLNNSPLVKDDTKRTVMEAIERLNYNPLKNIPVLSGVKVKTIGLVGPSAIMQENEFFINKAIVAFDHVMQEMNFDTRHYHDFTFCQKVMQGFQLARKELVADGYIFFCPRFNWQPAVKELHKWGIPLVLIRREAPVAGIPVITNNDADSVKAALGHFYNLGHRKIGLVTAKVPGHTVPRIDAYRSFMQEKNLACPDSFIFNFDKQELKDLDRWLMNHLQGKESFTALLCLDDQFAIQSIKTAVKHGYRVPEDLAVIGYNNSYIAEIYNPGLTSVNLPVQEMMQMAGKIIFELVQGAPVDSFEITMKTELVVRESCGSKLKLLKTVENY